MFSLDEGFLKELGIADLPEDVKGPLAEKLEAQIQDRISLKFAEGLTEAQIDEFGKINEGEMSDVMWWLRGVDPQYETSGQFVQLKEGAKDVGEDEIVRQYAQMKWLERNVPDYAGIVLETLNEVKEEILGVKKASAE